MYSISGNYFILSEFSELSVCIWKNYDQCCTLNCVIIQAVDLELNYII